MLTLVRWTVFAYLAVVLLMYLGIVVCLADSFRTARDRARRSGPLDPLRISFGVVATRLRHVPGNLSAIGIWRRSSHVADVCCFGLFHRSFTVSITRYRLMQLGSIGEFWDGLFSLSGLAAAVYYLLVFIGALVIGGPRMTDPPLEQAFVAALALVMTAGLDLGGRVCGCGVRPSLSSGQDPTRSYAHTSRGSGRATG